MGFHEFVSRAASYVRVPKGILVGLFALLPLFAFALSAQTVTIDWVTVGDPGNAADTEVMNDLTTGYGSVGYVYRISKYEITNAQYAEFLNAVAATDTNSLYAPEMGHWDPYRPGHRGEITRSGSSGSYTYSAVAGRESIPVVYVSFWDSLRFANWLHNGQPTGAQDSTTTEDGAYTITPAGIAANSITRNAEATVFLTSEDEWYKAAYYDAVSTSYYNYPAGTDTPIVCSAPGATGNTANCDYLVGDATSIGSYTSSASPAGTFDQGGNVHEWNEAIIPNPGDPVRGVRDGSWPAPWNLIAASYRNKTQPEREHGQIGFRVASLPEPAPDCSDGADNDGDGLADFPDDPGCADASDLSEHSPLLPCDDGAHNDADGLADYPSDPGCFGPTFPVEDPPCDDGLDNDGDLLIDFGSDPYCEAPWFMFEGPLPSACGLGIELVPLLGALLWLLRRRRHFFPLGVRP
jgi:formylglycine-generating enzyme required for sulfatase activity